MTGNTMTGGTHGVELANAVWTTVEGNTIRGASGTGLSLRSGAVEVVGNTICDNGTNVTIDPEAQATLEDNEICEDAPADPSE